MQQESSGLIDPPVMTSPSLSTAQMGKRKRSSVGLVSIDTKLEIAGLKSTITCLELQISGLQNQNNMYTCKNYELSIAMDILQELCLKKISTMESKSQSSEATEEIKKMVKNKFYSFFKIEYLFIFPIFRRCHWFMNTILLKKYMSVDVAQKNFWLQSINLQTASFVLFLFFPARVFYHISLVIFSLDYVIINKIYIRFVSNEIWSIYKPFAI